MSENQRCPRCQRDLPAEAPSGLCPNCLLRVGLTGSLPPSPEPSLAATSQGAARFSPPWVEELAGKIANIEILELIGSGGMGAVYKARQRGLDRVVALKIMPDEVSREPSFAARFAREARAMARLNHPHIVTVHDFGQCDGLCFIVMEYVDGVNLRQAMNAGALSPDQALALVPQICDALQYAHNEGIVHRDIKPENILLDRHGRAKIADFGLSKLMASVRDDDPEGSLTGTQQVMGTPRYMAPEQLRGTKGVDHRADIYSLGVVFYEMLTGQLPIGRFLLPSQKVMVDVRLDEIVLRALEQEPQRRYQQASEIKTDVEEVVRSGSAREGPSERLRRDPWESPGRSAGPTTAPDSTLAPALLSLNDDDPEITSRLAVAKHLVRGPALGMVGVGIAALLQSTALFAALMFLPKYWMWGIKEDDAAHLIAPLGLPYGLLMIMAGWHVIRLRGYTLGVLAGVLASAAPLGFVWPIAIAVAIWLHIVLWKREIKVAFDLVWQRRMRAIGENAIQERFAPHEKPGISSPAGKLQLATPGPFELRDRLRKSGLFLAITAGLNLAFWIGLVFVSAVALNLTLDRGDDIDLARDMTILLMVLRPLPVLVAAFQLLATIKMRRLESRSWAVTAVVLSMILYSPTWIIGFPLGLYAARLLKIERKAASDAGLSVFNPTGVALLVPVLAIFNLLTAIVLLAIYAAEDPFPVSEAFPRIWQWWSLFDTVAGFLLSAGLFASAVGMLLWKEWARRLAVVLSVLSLAALVLGMPYYMRAMIPQLAKDLEYLLGTEDRPTVDVSADAQTIVIGMFALCLAYGLPWIIGQIVYLSRPTVVAAFQRRPL